MDHRLSAAAASASRNKSGPIILLTVLLISARIFKNRLRKISTKKTTAPLPKLYEDGAERERQLFGLGEAPAASRRKY
jgi:hypothetical protein